MFQLTGKRLAVLLPFLLIGLMLAYLLWPSEGALSPTPDGRASAGAQAHACGLEFDTVSLALGPVYPGKSVSEQFIYTNRAETDLFIESVQAECDCTAFHLADRSVPPGVSGEIVLRFVPPEAIGGVVKKASVYVKGYEDDPIELSVTAEVVGAQLFPRSIDFGTVDGRKEHKRTIEIWPKGITISTVRIGNVSERLSYSIRNLGGAFEIEVRTRQDLQAGYFQEQCELVVEAGEEFLYSVTVEGRAHRGVWVDPESMMFGFVSSGTKTIRRAKVALVEGRGKLLGLDFPKQFLDVSAEQIEGGKVFEISASFRGVEPFVSFRESIKLTLEGEDRSVIQVQIPVYALGDDFEVTPKK